MTNRSKIVIAGGSGFIGNALILELKADYEVVILSRSAKLIEDATVAQWTGHDLGDWTTYVDGAFALINLVGEPITLPWTDENKKKILDSRVESTTLMAKAIRTVKAPPKVWINASAVGYYGDTGDEVKDETSPAGDDFLAETCLAWERAQDETEVPQTRKVKLRVGFVLGRDGGAFPQLAKLTKGFLGGAVGNGHQWVPWIDLRDLARMFRWAAETEIKGHINGVGPEPVQKKDLMAAMRHAAHRPWSPPAPAFAVKLAGSVIGMQTDVALVSQRAVPKVALEKGFQFQHSDLAQVLQELFEGTENKKTE